MRTSEIDWDKVFEAWEQPASVSEETKIERAAAMVRVAVSNNDWLTAQGGKVYAQGSYFNNTNVRLDSDMDLRVVHPALYVRYSSNVLVSAANSLLNYGELGISVPALASTLRQQVENSLVAAFGAANVDGTGNKAIEVKGIDGSRAKADVVPVLRLHLVEWSALSNQYVVTEGVVLVAKNGSEIYNFPYQHHRRGVVKRERTKHRFKKAVRTLKRLQTYLVKQGHLTEAVAPSYLIECLVYSIPDVHFLVETDNRHERMVRLLGALDQQFQSLSWVTAVTEINEIKALFHPSQRWTSQDAKTLVSKAHEVISH